MYKGKGKKKRAKAAKRSMEVYGRLDKEKIRALKSTYTKPQTYRRETPAIPSLNLDSVHISENACARNTMIERVNSGQIVGAEAEEIRRKSKCLAPAYNKGAYQYVGTHDAAQDAGRKK